MEQQIDMGAAKAQAVIGGVVAATPLWATIMQNISIVASCIAAVCGAIIGIHGVWKIYKAKKHRR